jgi:CubicO group peptidase (beta-lactamase class C family)
VIVLLLVPCGSVAGQQSALGAVDRYVTAELSRQHIPGVSVAVIRNDSVLLRRGYGLANVELGVPASGSTLYQSGSLGKQFTAAAVVMLAEQGRLSLDDRISQWLPEGGAAWKDITVRLLLTHTSGMAEYTDSTFDYRKDYTEDQLVKFAASRPLDFPPGDRWSYSNTGYVLLGVLIHRVTGQFYGDVLQRLIFGPLEMRTARIISEADIVPNRSAGYQLVKDQLKNQDWVAPSLNTTADGSLYLSINDLVEWAHSLDHLRIPDSTALQVAWSRVRLNSGGRYPYGFGWDLMPQRGHPRIGHTGSWQGFKTAIYRYPEYGLTVIALANLAQAQPGALAEGIAGLFEPALTPPHRLSAALPDPRPPIRDEQLLARVAKGADTAVTTPALQRFLSASSRRELSEELAPIEGWQSLGCDDIGGRKISWLSSPIARACYVVGKGPETRVIATLYYSPDWRLALFEVGRF